MRRLAKHGVPHGEQGQYTGQANTNRKLGVESGGKHREDKAKGTAAQQRKEKGK